MADRKKVTLEVAVEKHDAAVKELEKELDSVEKKAIKIKNDKIQLKIDADTSKLKEIESETKKIQTEMNNLFKNARFNPDAFKVDTKHINELQSKLNSLENKQLNIKANIDQSKLQIEKNNIQMKVNVEKEQLSRAKSEADQMDGMTINMALNLAWQSFSEGIRTCMQGVRDLISNMGEVENKFKQFESNQAFLTLNLGADKADEKLKQIQNTVAKMPGDDATMTSVLSSAVAMGNDLSQSEMETAVKTMADYMAGSEKLGKMARETQQDILKYLLDGNTAELERGSIVSQYVDELKNANTFKERQVAMQKVLNKLGYDGMASMPTLANKQAEWNGMLDQSMAKVGSLWSKAEMGAIDYILKLNESMNGLAGMGIVIGQMVVGPFAELLTGIGQVGTGIQTLRKGLNSIPKGLDRIGQSIGSLVTNPYVLLIAAIAAVILILWNLYNTCEPVKQAFDHVGEALGRLWDKLSTALQPAIEAITKAWEGFMEALGLTNGDILDGIIFFIVAFAEGLVLIIDGITQFINWVQQLWESFNQLTGGIDWMGWLQVLGLVLMGPIGWILLLIQHWNQIAPAVSNALSGMYNAAVGWFARTLAGIIAFGVNLVMEMKSRAKEAVDSFLAPFVGLVEAISAELEAVKSTVMSYIQPLIDAFNALGSAAAWAFSVLGLGQKSPGDIYKAMKRELNWTTEFVKRDDAGLVEATGSLGSDVVGSFNPQLSTRGISSGGAGTVINNEFNFTFTDFIDDKERLTNLIVKTITDKINWDNTTANRTV